MNTHQKHQPQESLPPRWPDRLLQWFCQPELLPEIQGDLHEYFHRWVQQYGLRKARWFYLYNVITFFRPFALGKRKLRISYPLNHTAMLRNYLLITLRSLGRKKVYTAINITGLAIGVAAFMVILTYVSKELSYDRFWPGHENIYRVSHKQYQHGEFKDHFANNMLPIAEMARQQLPEVQHATRFTKLGDRFTAVQYEQWIDADNEEFENDSDRFLLSDSSFFDVFPMPFIRGNAEAFRVPGATVITRKPMRSLERIGIMPSLKVKMILLEKYFTDGEVLQLRRTSFI